MTHANALLAAYFRCTGELGDGTPTREEVELRFSMPCRVGSLSYRASQSLAAQELSADEMVEIQAGRLKASGITPATFDQLVVLREGNRTVYDVVGFALPQHAETPGADRQTTLYVRFSSDQTAAGVDA